MKKLLLPLLLILLAGCDYEVSLSQKPSAFANPALAGSWIEQKSAETNQMDIGVSKADYSVTYGEMGEEPLTFKGFEISAAGFNLIQLELQGVKPTDAQKDIYLYVKYELTPEGLLIYRLNTDVVSGSCQTTEEMLNDLAVHRNNPFLFQAPLKFTRSVAE